MFEVLICLLVSSLFLLFGTYKKDFPSLLLSSIAFVLTGLMIVKLIEQGFGTVVIFFGLYVGLRSAIDLITNSLNNKGGAVWQKKKRK